jgi:hypothetical protein
MADGKANAGGEGVSDSLHAVVVCAPRVKQWIEVRCICDRRRKLWLDINDPSDPILCTTLSSSIYVDRDLIEWINLEGDPITHNKSSSRDSAAAGES